MRGIAAVLGVLLVACGGDETAVSEATPGGGGSQAGFGGAAGTGGALPGAGGLTVNGGVGANGGAGAKGGTGATGGTGGGAAIGDSLLAICNAYVEAECQRLFDCGLLHTIEDSCASPRRICPYFLFSPGSTRTAENTVACIEEWKTFSCDDLAIDKAPSCATAGTRQPGDKCVYDQQCNSGYCNAQSADCGTCATLAAPGGACQAGSVYCPDGQTCTAGTCVDVSPVTVVPRTPAQAGAPCTMSSICPMGYFCSLDTSSRVEGHCLLPPGSGQPCGHEIWGLTTCASGLYCAPDVTCQPPPALGQPCTTECQPDSFCATGTCKARLDVGGACFVSRASFQSSCLAGLECICNDAQCITGTCYEPRAEGAPCGDPRGHCIEGATCVNDRCVSDDATAHFTALCGP